MSVQTPTMKDQVQQRLMQVQASMYQLQQEEMGLRNMLQAIETTEQMASVQAQQEAPAPAEAAAPVATQEAPAQAAPVAAVVAPAQG